MQTNNAYENVQAVQTLDNIKSALNTGKEVILIDADLYLTKGQPGRALGEIFRDKSLEEEVMQWLISRTSFSDTMQRYKAYDPNLTEMTWPKHYAARFINTRGTLAEGDNIFMFFPHVLGLYSGGIEDYFGFEFIDVWVSVFDEVIFPCMKKVFDHATQLQLFSVLRPKLEKTIYLASVFHEIGHRCGYWKVSPVKDERVHINKFHTDVLGELTTDTLLVNFLQEFPEVLYCVFLQRLFWFGRFGFKDNPINGKLNEDNDTWIGAYLWNKYIEFDVLTQNEDYSWHVHFEKLASIFSEVLKDVDQLGDQVVKNPSAQDNVIHQWMQSRVECKKEQFILPQEMQNALIRCVGITEKPSEKG